MEFRKLKSPQSLHTHAQNIEAGGGKRSSQHHGVVSSVSTYDEITDQTEFHPATITASWQQLNMWIPVQRRG